MLRGDLRALLGVTQQIDHPLFHGLVLLWNQLMVSHFQEFLIDFPQKLNDAPNSLNRMNILKRSPYFVPFLAFWMKAVLHSQFLHQWTYTPHICLGQAMNKRTLLPWPAVASIEEHGRWMWLIDSLIDSSKLLQKVHLLCMVTGFYTREHQHSEIVCIQATSFAVQISRHVSGRTPTVESRNGCIDSRAQWVPYWQEVPLP